MFSSWMRALGLTALATLAASCKDDKPATTVNPDASVPECNAPDDCPDPGNECLLRLCLDHKCGVSNAAHGTPLAAQTAGDCQRAVCDGNGGTTSEDDPADLLADDKQCTSDACRGGSLVHDPVAARTACSEGGGRLCDGAGACVGCIDDRDCAAGSCSGGACLAPTCADGTKNGDETDVDCGGDLCRACGLQGSCAHDQDCGSGLCAAGRCASTTPIITRVSTTGHDRFFGVTFDHDGSIYTTGVVSSSTLAASDFATVIAKFSPTGVLDPTFGTAGIVTQNLAVGRNGELTRTIALQSTGKIVIAATIEHAGASDIRDRDIAIARFDSHGALDTTFGTGGVTVLDLSDGMAVGNGFIADSVWAVAVYPDDKLLLSGAQVRPGGTDTDFALIRLTANGAIDNTFGTNGVTLVDIDHENASARACAILPDGSAMGSGYMEHAGVIMPVLYKVTSSGQLDTSFGNGGVFNRVVLASQTEIYSFGLQGTKIVTAGYGRTNAMTESLDWLSLRVLANGTLDPTYGSDGVARLDIGGFGDNARNVLVLPDQRVMLIGGGRPTANDVDGVVAILSPNGQPDTNFSPTGFKRFDLGGVSDMLWSVSIAPSKSYVAAVGLKGAGTTGLDDDSALLLVPLGANPGQ